MTLGETLLKGNKGKVVWHVYSKLHAGGRLHSHWFWVRFLSRTENNSTNNKVEDIPGSVCGGLKSCVAAASKSIGLGAS